VIFDSDVLIWALRGNNKAVEAIEAQERRAVSIVSCMELFQGARDKRELAAIRRFLLEFETLPLSENIGYRASIYLEEYALKAGQQLADALIAATAVANQETLCSGNARHYRAISEIKLRTFRP
jgi:predicted nucleic acid-binding protein